MTKPRTDTTALRQHESGIWYIHYHVAGRSRRVSTKTRDHDKAMQELGHFLLKTSAAAGEVTKFLTRDCLNRYWNEHASRNTQDPGRIEVILRWLDRGLGDYLVHNLRPALFNEYVEDRLAGTIGSRPAQISTVRRELSCLRSVFEYCVKTKMIPSDVVPYIALPAIPAKEAFWLTQDQIDYMLSELKKPDAPYRVYLFVCLGLATGARKNAIENLKWSQVDFDAGMIRYDKQVTVQTRKRKVAVPMSDWLRKVLTAARMSHPKDKFVLGDSSPIRHQFDALKNRLSKHDRAFKKMTPHTLRHTAATQMLRSGASVWQVAGMLGDTVETISNIYGHHVADHVKQGAELWEIESNDT